MPWNAALATVVLASLITLLWYEQPVPQAVPDDALTQAAGHAAVEIPAPANVPAPAVASDAQAPPVQDASRARSRPERDEPAARQSTQPKPEPLARVAGALGEAKNETGPPLAAAPAPSTEESPSAAGSVRPNSTISLAAETTAAPARSSSPAPSTATAVAPMPAAPVAAAKALSAPSEMRGGLAEKEKRRADLGLAAGSRASAPPSSVEWSELSVRRVGSLVVLSSAQASRLVVLLQPVSLRAAQAGDPVASAENRLELSRGGERVATLDLDDRWLRWTPVGTDLRGTLIGRASVAQWEAIQDELARLGLRAP